MPPYTYTITDLGANNHPTAVNDSGQVVGFADVDTSTNVYHAFFTDPHSSNLIDLHDATFPSTVAFALNDIGRVVGGAVRLPDPPRGHAWYCGDPPGNPLQIADLQKVESQLVSGIARGIDHFRNIVGHQFHYLSKGGKRYGWHTALFWPSGGANAVPLPLFSDQYPGSKAAAINETGRIVGRANIDDAGNFVGCLWDTYQAPPRPLEPPAGFAQSYGWAMNRDAPVGGAGVSMPSVVGIYGPGVDARGINPVDPGDPPTSPIRYACRWDPSLERIGKKVLVQYAVTPLFPDPPPISFAFGINDTGLTVGMFHDPNGSPRAFLIGPNWLEPLDLTDAIEDNPDGWVLTMARGINNKGQIVGDGSVGGKGHGFLLTPSRPLPPPWAA